LTPGTTTAATELVAALGRAVGALAALHLDEFRYRFRTETGEIGRDGGALCLCTEP
jgi:hypothetical protein